ALVDALSPMGADPRVVGAAALSYAALRDHLFTDDAQPQVIVDIGHKKTAVCIVRDARVLFARVIPRGGEQVTAALADEFQLSLVEAERLKHEHARILNAGGALQTLRISDCLREATRSLIRELRQTFAAFRADGGTALERIRLLGGGARLHGLAEHLQAELGI